MARSTSAAVAAAAVLLLAVCCSGARMPLSAADEPAVAAAGAYKKAPRTSLGWVVLTSESGGLRVRCCCPKAAAVPLPHACTHAHTLHAPTHGCSAPSRIGASDGVARGVAFCLEGYYTEAVSGIGAPLSILRGLLH